MTRPALANLNGEQLPLTEVKVSALDRGFLFGDSVYEVLRVYGGKPWLLEEHWDRLTRSLQALRITGVDLPRLRQRLLDTLRASGFAEAMIYLQVTRGVAPRNHAFPTNATPTEFLWVQEFIDPYPPKRQEGVTVVTQPDLRWERCDIKTTNLLGNILAYQNAIEAGCHEALLYLPDGTMTEATHSSFFAVLDGYLLTSPNSSQILPGMTRNLILRLAKKADLPAREQYLQRGQLRQVSELFLTGTTSEILPIVRVDGQPVGAGRPGPVTRRLQELYAEAVREFLARA